MVETEELFDNKKRANGVVWKVVGLAYIREELAK